jgi:hypothetical protein
MDRGVGGKGKNRQKKKKGKTGDRHGSIRMIRCLSPGSMWCLGRYKKPRLEAGLRKFPGSKKKESKKLQDRSIN